MMFEADQSENTPLLETPGPQQGRVGRLCNVLPQWTWIQWRVTLLAAFLMFSVNFGHFMGTAPQLAIFENVICENYKRSLGREAPYTTVEFDNNICKSEPVQSELAFLLGWKNTLDVLPGWFNWPLRLVWLTGMFRAPRGGDQFATFILMTIIADVLNEEQRTVALFRLASLPIITEVVVTPISATVMKIRPWIPFLLGPIVVLIGAAFSILVPETIDKSKTIPTPEESSQREVIGSLAPSKQNALGLITSKAEKFVTETKFLWQTPKRVISLGVVFAGILDKSSLFLLIQYASNKLPWTIARASYLISIRGCMTLATFLGFVPLLSSYLTRQLHYTTLKKDLAVAKIAVVAGSIGYFLIFLASDAALLTIGCLSVSVSMPFVVTVISIATYFTPAERVATLYTAMSVSQSIGIIIAGPIFAKLYSAGMHIGLEWSGLPFLAAASLFPVIMIPLLFLGPGS
ncbi:uncharacterized protein N7483_011273 [Penicillium malachiteum]|uniref:uncharacterized protein n=1 Tax=Penicillium malachiteum TaxID=1324776 RepID=UPI0025499FF4|nr:uncharacterized protein N7483_011273 [Penicillium malachiteum]KAJ5714092.1 hypothetical protein N7483_011273 [Penicillium malachiteum]